MLKASRAKNPTSSVSPPVLLDLQYSIWFRTGIAIIWQISYDLALHIYCPTLKKVPPSGYFRFSVQSLFLSNAKPCRFQLLHLTHLWSLLLISEEMLYFAPTLAFCRRVGNCFNCGQLKRHSTRVHSCQG